MNCGLSIEHGGHENQTPVSILYKTGALLPISLDSSSSAASDSRLNLKSIQGYNIVLRNQMCGKLGPHIATLRSGKHCQTSLAEKRLNGFSFCLLEVLGFGRGAPT